MNVQLKKLNDYTWMIEKQGSMKVPAIIYSSEKLIRNINKDNTLKQLMNVASLKGIIKHALAMPDAHEGYGFPIGGVAAFRVEDGLISPGGVGYDINCGVRLLKTNVAFEEIKNKIKDIVDEIFKRVPVGVGVGGRIKLTKEELIEVLAKGANWALEHGYALKQDLERTEEYGYMREANPEFVSDRALQRGKNQLGSLGSGNHFLEVQMVQEIYDEEIAKKFGMFKNQITAMIHCGSRGLGHQIASDYIHLFEQKFGFENLPDKELINAPFNSKEGQMYYKAMCAAVNFAFANRQIIAHNVREAFRSVSIVEVEQLYGV